MWKWKWFNSSSTAHHTEEPNASWEGGDNFFGKIKNKVGDVFSLKNIVKWTSISLGGLMLLFSSCDEVDNKNYDDPNDNKNYITVADTTTSTQNAIDWPPLNDKTISYNQALDSLWLSPETPVYTFAEMDNNPEWFYQSLPSISTENLKFCEDVVTMYDKAFSGVDNWDFPDIASAEKYLHKQLYGLIESKFGEKPAWSENSNNRIDNFTRILWKHGIHHQIFVNNWTLSMFTLPYSSVLITNWIDYVECRIIDDESYPSLWSFFPENWFILLNLGKSRNSCNVAWELYGKAGVTDYMETPADVANWVVQQEFVQYFDPLMTESESELITFETIPKWQMINRLIDVIWYLDGDKNISSQVARYSEYEDLYENYNEAFLMAGIDISSEIESGILYGDIAVNILLKSYDKFPQVIKNYKNLVNGD